MKKYFNIITASVGIMLSGACHKAENAKISPIVVQTSNPITTDTLSGAVKGTLVSGKTYYFASNITVNGGDTLLMQAGSKLIALGDGLTWQTAPEIFVHGTFISLGTEANPNYITVSNAATLKSQAAQQNYTNVFQGWWGGIFAEPGPVTSEDPTPAGGDMIIKWTHLEFAGGPSGPDDDQVVYTSRKILYWKIRGYSAAGTTACVWPAAMSTARAILMSFAAWHLAKPVISRAARLAMWILTWL
jgi:hypothetical protein